MATEPNRRPQHMEALGLANKIRSGQADLKREMGRGELSWREALIDPRAQPMRVGVFLLAMHGFGDQRVGRLVRELEIGAIRRVRELTPRQRVQLLTLLAEIPPTEESR